MNAQYNLQRVRRATGAFNWPTLTCYMQAWRGAYVFDAAHETVSDVTASGGTLVATSLALLDQQVTSGGYLRSGPVAIPAIAPSSPITFLLLVRDTGGGAAAYAPIAYYDDAIGLPFTPNGLEWLIQPDWLSERGWLRA